MNFMHFLQGMYKTYMWWKLKYRKINLIPHSCFSCHPFPALTIFCEMWETCWKTNILLSSSLLLHYQELLIVSLYIFYSGEWRWCTICYMNDTLIQHGSDLVTSLRHVWISWILLLQFLAYRNNNKILNTAHWKLLPSVVTGSRYLMKQNKLL
jgi:hypothetical protein